MVIPFLYECHSPSRRYHLCPPVTQWASLLNPLFPCSPVQHDTYVVAWWLPCLVPKREIASLSLLLNPICELAWSINYVWQCEMLSLVPLWTTQKGMGISSWLQVTGYSSVIWPSLLKAARNDPSILPNTSVTYPTRGCSLSLSLFNFRFKWREKHHCPL